MTSDAEPKGEGKKPSKLDLIKIEVLNRDKEKELSAAGK